jgi:hypothetical protein
MSNAEVTVADLDALILQIKEKEDVIEAAERVVKDHNIELGTLKGKAAAYLIELKRTEYTSPIGKIENKKTERVNLPESIPEKLQFFDHLKEKGMFENYATINSASLNAYYFREREQYIRDGGDPMLFSLPGVPAPKSFVKLEFKESKESKMKSKAAIMQTSMNGESDVR